MDFWIPLLGGALGAALINGIVAVYKVQRDRAIEHEQWLRDQKLELYANFLDSYEELYKQIKLSGQDTDTNTNLDAFIAAASPTKLILVAPEPVATMARSIYDQLLWLNLSRGLRPAPHNLPDDERKYGEMSRNFEQAVIDDMRGVGRRVKASSTSWTGLRGN